MHTLDVSDEEAEVLRDVLTSALSQLHDEIAHTDDRAYRDGLKNDRVVIRQLLERLPREEPIET